MANRRSSGPDTATRQVVIDRADFRCERCGKRLLNKGASIHHRIPRGAGGTKDPLINHPVNLALLCGTGTTGCHGWVESNRSEAYATGWLVHRWEDPSTVLITDLHGNRFIFDDHKRIDLREVT